MKLPRIPGRWPFWLAVSLAWFMVALVSGCGSVTTSQLGTDAGAGRGGAGGAGGNGGVSGAGGELPDAAADAPSDVVGQGGSAGAPDAAGDGTAGAAGDAGRDAGVVCPSVGGVSCSGCSRSGVLCGCTGGYVGCITSTVGYTCCVRDCNDTPASCQP